MNPDELPEREVVRISYGTLHYQLDLQGKMLSRDQFKYEVHNHVNKALFGFHDNVHTMAKEHARVTGLLYDALKRLGPSGHDIGHKLHSEQGGEP